MRDSWTQLQIKFEVLLNGTYCIYKLDQAYVDHFNHFNLLLLLLFYWVCTEGGSKHLTLRGFFFLKKFQNKHKKWTDEAKHKKAE